MRRVSQIRDGLGRIPGCIKDFPPDPGFRGEEPGVATTPIWTGDYEAVDQPGFPNKSFFDPVEEDENDGTPEVRVAQQRRSDQQPPRELVLHASHSGGRRGLFRLRCPPGLDFVPI